MTGSQTTIHLLFGGPVYTIRHGKIGWRFEMHRWCGPVVVDHRNEPKAEQPSDKSHFWRAVTNWAQQGERVTSTGLCLYENTP